jgi:uncharacterized OB-fold protein
VNADVTPLIPVVDDPDTGGFFEAARRHELAVCFCASCDAALHLPRAYCHRCGAWGNAWRAVAVTGTLHSFTIVEHQVHPAFPVPYTIVLVDIDGLADVRLIGDLPGRPLLEIGMAMRVRFDDVADGVVLPRWEPAAPVASA